MGSVAIAINLLLALLDRAAVIGQLISTAQREGRDITPAELDTLAANDDAARAALQKAIDDAKAGRP